MQSAIYFPFIRGREGEINALHRLSPFARSRIAVVVDLPTVELAPSRALEEYVGKFVCALASAWGAAPLYLDMTRYGPEHVDQRDRHIVEYLFDCARQRGLKAVPVTGPLLDRGPGASYLEAIARIAARDGRGAALRLLHVDFSHETSLAREIEAGLATLSLPARSVDLFLDAGGLDRLPAADAAEPVLTQTVVNALRIIQQYPFRIVLFTGSSVPDPLPKHPEGEPLRIERGELRVWKQLVRRKDLLLLRFGDTGIWSPHQPDQGGGGGAPPARVRLPIREEQLFFKAKGPEYRKLALDALTNGGADTLPRCWGLDSIRRAAAGSGGVDCASGWVARDTNLHIEATARVVGDHLIQIGRVNEVPLAVEDKSPWQQEFLLE